MARVTAQALQDQLNSDAGGDNVYRVIKEEPVGDGSVSMNYYVSNIGGGPQAGKTCWCRTTVSGNLAAQTAEIVAAITAPGPNDTDVYT